MAEPIEVTAERFSVDMARLRLAFLSEEGKVADVLEDRRTALEARARQLAPELAGVGEGSGSELPGETGEAGGSD